MPLRRTPHKPGTKKYLENCSYELQCACWFSQAGWQVFTPLFDHGHKTDLLVSDGANNYRIQVKTAENASVDSEICNQWNGSSVDYIALFAKNSSWGTIFPAFLERKRKLTSVDGSKFELNKSSFMKAFYSLP